MRIVRLGEVEKTPVRMEGAKGAFKQLMISSRDGAPAFSFRVFTVKAGGHTPFHAHAAEHLNYVIRGRGVLAAEAGERAIGPGTFALVLPGEKHQYRNTSETEDLVFICAVPKEWE